VNIPAAPLRRQTPGAIRREAGRVSLEMPFTGPLALAGNDMNALLAINEQRYSTIRLERFPQSLYNCKVSESVEDRLELC
jgi:hypothetical protein